MSVEEEYYINLHVEGKFVRDPHVKHKEIDLYVEHGIDTVVFVDDESMLAVACLQFGGDGNEGGEGGEVVGSGEGSGEVAGNKGGEGIGEGGKGAEGLGGEGDDISVSEGGESDGGGEEGVREVEGKTNGKGKETVLDETESESSREQFEAEVPEEVDGEGLNNNVGREKDGNETKYFDSDDHGSILMSKDDDSIDVCRRRSRFPTYNPNSTSPHFYIGMLFKDDEQFKSAIRKYSMCCRRELKIIRN
ncbi:hypothetical protein Gotri_027007 [Gossypium trilobum]|uniref:Transposase MuDR plant domain-containing protein n=1 Tax=Gossypium trilobum TaxID=34281 RepID=A0A7J9FWW9_9ROSI|nr:hypothetical protein [Gossypium trilobum]